VASLNFLVPTALGPSALLYYQNTDPFPIVTTNFHSKVRTGFTNSPCNPQILRFTPILAQKLKSSAFSHKKSGTRRNFVPILRLGL